MMKKITITLQPVYKGYEVVKTTNTLDPIVGSKITEREAELLVKSIHKEVTITRSTK